MARKVDITDKLSFEENPSLVIKGKTLEEAQMTLDLYQEYIEEREKVKKE